MPWQFIALWWAFGITALISLIWHHGHEGD